MDIEPYQRVYTDQIVRDNLTAVLSLGLGDDLVLALY